MSNTVSQVILIKENISSIEIDGLTLATFTALIAKYENDYSDIHIVADYYGYDGGAEFFLCGWRPENVKEKKERLEKEARAAEIAEKARLKIEEKERKVLAALLKKYG